MARQTRKDKAAELARLVSQGPSFSPFTFGGSDSGKPPHEVAMRQTQIWLDTWVRPLVRELVPELRDPTK